MKPTELRIGSLFWGAGMVQTVKEIIKYGDQPGYEYLIMCEENGNQYKPIEMQGIPLTEEWLKKFGFEKMPDFDIWVNKEIWIYSNTEDNYFFHDYTPKEIRVEYVHQLQNLYFALTGKELENREDQT